MISEISLFVRHGPCAFHNHVFRPYLSGSWLLDHLPRLVGNPFEQLANLLLVLGTSLDTPRHQAKRVLTFLGHSLVPPYHAASLTVIHLFSCLNS